MADVTVAYSADERMAMPMAVSIASAVANFRTPGASLEVVVIDGGLSPDSIQRLFPTPDDAARFRFRVVKPDPICMHGISLHRYGVASLYRLQLGRLLRDRRRAIYLDADTIVEHDLHELWQESNGDAPLWARQDWLFPVMSHPLLRARCEGLGMQPDDPYFNSGVLVVSLDAWRAQDFGTSVLEFLREHRADCPWPDQDALNAVFRGRWRPLNERWNRYSHEISELKTAGVIHFIGAEAKPWLGTPDDRLANRRFFHYFQKTVWAG